MSYDFILPTTPHPTNKPTSYQGGRIANFCDLLSICRVTVHYKTITNYITISQAKTKEMDSSDVKCSTCDKKDIVTFCLVCRGLYCNDCSRPHGNFGATKHHCVITISSGEIRNLEEGQLNCFSCKNENLESTATSFCPVCLELMCQKCDLFHSRLMITKQHRVTTLSRDGHRTTSKAPSKMAGKVQKESIDDGQFASDFKGAVHNTGATNVDFTVAQAPLSVLSSGAVTVDKVGGASNVTTQSVTNMSYVGDFVVKSDTDREECDITDITCLSDGRVVVCNYYNKVKVYNTDCKYLYSVQCSDYLCGITVVSSNTVVVIEDTTTLRYLQLDTQRGVRLDKYIDISPGACAVSYAVRTFAVLYPWSDREVVMIDDSGVQLTVVKLTQVKGDIPWAILLDSSGTRFHICDSDSHRVLCYRCQPGHTGVLWECSVSPYPRSVVHVGDSLVVFCEEKVHEINKSGHYLQEVVVHGKNFDISLPVAAFQTSCRKLVVTSWLTGNSKVQIFQL